jgi:hypothetical protein
MLVVVVVGRYDLTPAIEAAVRADPMGPPRLMALGAGVDRRRTDLVLRAALVGARVRLLLLGNRHRRQKGID